MRIRWPAAAVLLRQPSACPWPFGPARARLATGAIRVALTGLGRRSMRVGRLIPGGLVRWPAVPGLPPAARLTVLPTVAARILPPPAAGPRRSGEHQARPTRPAAAAPWISDIPCDRRQLMAARRVPCPCNSDWLRLPPHSESFFSATRLPAACVPDLPRTWRQPPAAPLSVATFLVRSATAACWEAHTRTVTVFIPTAAMRRAEKRRVQLRPSILPATG